jgi:TonB family protein
MGKTFATVSLLVLLSAVAYGQSGRARGSTAKWPTPPPPRTPVASPSAEPKAKPARRSPPKFVDGERIYLKEEVDQRVQILNKPDPAFTREARRHLTRGYVVLGLILAADGTVKHIETLTGLPDGLSEKSIEAAKQIKFKPAMKDGKPVSVWVEVEYQFQVF